MDQPRDNKNDDQSKVRPILTEEFVRVGLANNNQGEVPEAMEISESTPSMSESAESIKNSSFKPKREASQNCSSKSNFYIGFGGNRQAALATIDAVRNAVYNPNLRPNELRERLSAIQQESYANSFQAMAPSTSQCTEKPVNLSVNSEDKLGSVGIAGTEKDTCHTFEFYSENKKKLENFLSTNNSYTMIMDDVPDYSFLSSAFLKPNTGCKFNVSVFNNQNQSECANVSMIKTLSPANIGPPTSVEVSKNASGLHLSWKKPTISDGEITGYSVSLAVNYYNCIGHKIVSFVDVYCGPETNCCVRNEMLDTAYVDTTSGENALIFRIFAKHNSGNAFISEIRYVASSETASKRASNETVVGCDKKPKID